MRSWEELINLLDLLFLIYKTVITSAVLFIFNLIHAKRLPISVALLVLVDCEMPHMSGSKNIITDFISSNGGLRVVGILQFGKEDVMMKTSFFSGPRNCVF